MDSSNWGPTQGGSSSGVGDPTMESGDWRAQLQPDSRQRIVGKIMETLKKHLPLSGQEGLQELTKIAVKFEEKIYSAATDQTDYLRKISLKMLSMENKSQNVMTNKPSNNAGSQGMQQVNNQGQQQLPIPTPSNHPQTGASGSGLSQPTMSNVVGPQNLSGNAMGQGVSVPPANFANQRRQQQQYQYQEQFNQIAKQTLQKSNITLSMQTSSLSTVQQNQQQPVGPQSAQPLLQQQQQLRQRQPNPVGPQANSANVQPGQQGSYPERFPGQQSALSSIQQPQQQHLIGQHNNLSTMHQQHLGPQSGVSGQQQQLLGAQSGQNNPHMLQSKVLVQQQNQQSSAPLLPTQVLQPQPQLQQQMMAHLQSQSGPTQQQQQQKSMPNLVQRDMQQRLPTPGTFQQQNITDQQKQLFQQQRAMPEASSNSTAQTGTQSGGDWQEEIYQKIKVMKDMYLPYLNDLHQKIIVRLQHQDSAPQQSKNDTLDRLRLFKTALERLIMFLQLQKSNIMPNYKDKLVYYERQIINFMNQNKRRPPATVPPHVHSGQQSLQQPQENSQIANLSGASMQQSGSGLDQGQNAKTNTGVSLQQNATSGPQQNPNMLQNQQLLQTHQLKQQFQQQIKQQQNPQFQGNQVPQVHQMGVKSAAFQRSGYPQQLKTVAPLNPSPQTEPSHPLAKPDAPLQSANSPFAAPSPSTSSASPMPGEFSGVSSLSNVVNAGNQQPTGASVPTQSLAIGTPGISASPLLAEFANPDGNHGNVASGGPGKSSATEQPLERLLKAVKSISPNALSASVNDIGSIVSMVDRLAESAPSNGSRAAVGEDLVSLTKCRLQARNLVTQDGTTATRRIRRFTSATPLKVATSAGSINEDFKLLSCGKASELDSTATSTIKRARTETNRALLQEIKEINRGLIDTVVEIPDEDADPAAAAAAEGCDGTVVKCSFRGISLGPIFKARYTSGQMSPIQPLRLFVPTNYPNCPPIFLDKLHVEVGKENEDLAMKMKSRFSMSLRSFSEPLSLRVIARTWDRCTRAVICEYAQQSGGGTFSSIYGTWDSCLNTA